MKILIIGSHGMLGHELIEVFKNENELILWDRDEINIADKEDVEKKIAGLMPEVVINAAAYTAVDDAEKNSDIAYNVNGYAVGYLCEACKKNDSLFVHFSTDYVFDGQNKNGYKEDDHASGSLNEYGKSKLLGEQMIAKVSPRHYLVRTAWLFGKSGKNFVETMLRLAGEKKNLKVVDDQIGSPTYAKDLAFKARELIVSRKPYGIYHITNSGICSWYEFAAEIFKLAKLDPKMQPVKSEEFPTPAKRPHYSVLINTKLPMVRSWKEALADYLIETGRIIK